MVHFTVHSQCVIDASECFPALPACQLGVLSDCHGLGVWCCRDADAQCKLRVGTKHFEPHILHIKVAQTRAAPANREARLCEVILPVEKGFLNQSSACHGSLLCTAVGGSIGGAG